MDQKKLVDIKSAVNKFINELEKRGIHPESVLLYGSYAKGTAKEYSDVDLVVVSKDFEKFSLTDRLKILSHAAWPVQAGIEPLGYTPREIAEGGKDSILWEEIEQNHKVVYKAA